MMITMSNLAFYLLAGILFMFGFVLLLVVLFSPFLYPALGIALILYLANRFKWI